MEITDDYLQDFSGKIVELHVTNSSLLADSSETQLFIEIWTLLCYSVFQVEHLVITADELDIDFILIWHQFQCYYTIIVTASHYNSNNKQM